MNSCSSLVLENKFTVSFGYEIVVLFIFALRSPISWPIFSYVWESPLSPFWILLTGWDASYSRGWRWWVLFSWPLVQFRTLDEPSGYSIGGRLEAAAVPIVAQWKRIQLGTRRLRVWSLALVSGSRVRHCCELWCRSQIWLRSGIAVALA